MPSSVLATHLPGHWPAIRGRGVVSHVIAAELWGLPVLGSHGRHLKVPASGQKYPDTWKRHWAALGPDDFRTLADGTRVTTGLRTVVDCGRTLPLYPAVAILDAALRTGLVTRSELVSAAAAGRCDGAPKLRTAVRWCDIRADSPQESVGRVALGRAGLNPTPQYVLNDGPLTHPYDLALIWARVVVDMQSKAHHSAWGEVVKDYEHLDEVDGVRGWKLNWSLPTMVLPDPDPFVRRVLGTVVTQPGPRCAALRRRYVDRHGYVIWPATTGKR